ncbi:hypothetical protein MUK42_33355 [Musa troglodytarum]|uniref:Uncharacterized protein n=1 Tax=Musa troglodytarum TaxID=320322 RepID=A0A9E7K9T9_9LILI|nr:hypothetical protein MUK42_33355 [Musa troglodytarum]
MNSSSGVDRKKERKKDCGGTLVFDLKREEGNSSLNQLLEENSLHHLELGDQVLDVLIFSRVQAIAVEGAKHHVRAGVNPAKPEWALQWLRSHRKAEEKTPLPQKARNPLVVGVSRRASVRCLLLQLLLRETSIKSQLNTADDLDIVFPRSLINLLLSDIMLSIGASYAQLHVQQEHYKQKIKRTEGQKKSKGQKKGSKGRVHPAGSSPRQPKADLNKFEKEPLHLRTHCITLGKLLRRVNPLLTLDGNLGDTGGSEDETKEEKRRKKQHWVVERRSLGDLQQWLLLGKANSCCPPNPAILLL